MFSDHKTTNKYLALFTFLVSLVIYCMTLAPTASFWDAGEFIAVAHGLQVNHPPGAPFYSIVGRIFSMFMPTEYVALSINFISALTSALSVMLLYLIIVRLIREWKGHPDSMDIMDKIGIYGGALVGSLTFAVTDTFWFSAVEAEVYAVSMFFTAIVVWLALKWSENHDKPYNEKWLVLIAYMFGLAIGVHLLNLLALFFVALIIYFKKREFEWKSFLIMGVVAVLSFFIVYPFTIQTLPSIANGVDSGTYGLIGPLTFIFLFMILVAWAVYYTHKKKYRLANIAAICYAMILIGFSSYSVIMIRSIADPPIDENDPETVEAFISYLKREQYGATPILKGSTYDDNTGQISSEEVFFPRRYSSNPQHRQYYAQYDSDWEFFWEYQVNHMYMRYFNWNFVGRDADVQDAAWQAGFSDTGNDSNTAHNSYFYIPLLLGLFGMIYHFRSDWQRAFAVLALFIVTGLAIIVFLNQTPFQPRERDYAYVGSFFAFSIWVGMGASGFIELIKEYLNESKILGYATILLCLIASPVWMGYQNWDDHDRSDRYVAPDYAKNLLNSVAPNAIIFTNGDNDTFPLWYAQEVEGIRTDVRIVCLSLLNTDWYIKQLRDQWSHESAPLPISLTDDEIEQITGGISQWQPKEITIPVNKEMLKEAFADTFQYKEATGVKPDTALPVRWSGVDFEMPVDSLDDQMTWRVTGRLYGQGPDGNNIHYLQTQDRVILDLLETNNWLRPMYFANTVSNSSQLNMQNFFRTEGKAYRIVPKKFSNDGSGELDIDIHADRLRQFEYREWNNPDLYLDENIRRMLSNYRFNFIQLADEYLAAGKPDSAGYWLKTGQEKIPFRNDEQNQTIKLYYAVKYAQAEFYDEALALAEEARSEAMDNLESSVDQIVEIQTEYTSLNNQLEAAQSNGNISEQRNLRTQMNSMASRYETVARNVQSSRQSVVIIQHIYFKTGETEKATQLAETVDTMLGPQFPAMPATLQQSEMEIRRYGL